ncbi:MULTISPECIES: hypothetical protein [Paenibacillus]|nr:MULTISPECIES: hypothetical protein [Paenibacillus]
MNRYGYMAVFAGALLLSGCSEAQSPQGAPPPPQQESPSDPPAESPDAVPDEEVAAEEERDQESDQPSAEKPDEEKAPDEGMPPTAKEAAVTVMRALKSGDMEAVAAWAHPEKGVRFSPYAHVDLENDQTLSREELTEALSRDTARVWGHFAGSGHVIELPYAEYHKQFVYDARFLEDAEVHVNQSIGKGTTVNNLNEVYPEETHDYVEFYIDGVDPQYEGIDWRSLRLVFEKNDMDRSLVGIVHDEWTP